MRVVSWNCRYGFTTEKLGAIQQLDADILVVQECSEKDWTGFLKPKYGDSSHWFADGKDSGGLPERNLGVFILCKEGLNPEKLYKDNDVKYRYVLPYKINGTKELTLFAVWTKKPVEKGATYHTPVFNFLKNREYDDKILEDKPALFIGDFNTGSVKSAYSGHWYEELKDKFREKKIYNCAGDQEWAPTFFRGNGAWLDDHCFATESLFSKVISFGMGNADYWCRHSDHCPIIVDFDF
jgi:endonuclease/exonuclease/phosphatase family metal-dependent hydrolase